MSGAYDVIKRDNEGKGEEEGDSGSFGQKKGEMQYEIDPLRSKAFRVCDRVLRAFDESCCSRGLERGGGSKVDTNAFAFRSSNIALESALPGLFLAKVRESHSNSPLLSVFSPSISLSLLSLLSPLV